MAPCEDVYDDPDDWFLPTPFAGWPPPGLPDSRPLVERPDLPYWLYLPLPPPEPESPRACGLLVGPTPSGTLVPCFVAGERLLSGDAVSLGLDGHLHLVRDSAVPFAVVGAPYSEGELVPIRAGQVYPHGAVALRPDGCFIEVELAPPGSDVVGFVTRVLELGETRSNRMAYATPSEETVRAAVAEIETTARIRAPSVFVVEPGDDGVAAELAALARAGDEARFRELATCVMPTAKVDGCWLGTRARLGLPA